MYTILICDDDRDIVSALDIYLSSEGYRTLKAYDGLECLRLVEQESVDLVLMDVMMSGLDGIRTTAKLRETCNIPIILLTAKSEDSDKVLGLNIGADDYVTKPFTPLELLARVNSQLRRYSRYLEKLKNGGVEEGHVYRIGGLELDEEKVELRVDGTPVKVTPMEYRILLLLMKHPGRVFSADEIYERVWNEKAVNSDTIMVHVRNIREKIEINPKNPKYLKVVWGVGYKMEKQ